MNFPQFGPTLGRAELPLLMPMEGGAGGWIEGDRDDFGIETTGTWRQRGTPGSTARRYGNISRNASRSSPVCREPMAERFRAYLADRLQAFPGLSARRLHREVPAMWYERAYSTLTEFLRPSVPRRFETAPGQQAQLDFAEFQVEFEAEPGVLRKVWLFGMVLGHSRWLWGRFCPNQTLETVMPFHIAAFAAMGGPAPRSSMTG